MPFQNRVSACLKNIKIRSLVPKCEEQNANEIMSILYKNSDSTCLVCSTLLVKAPQELLVKAPQELGHLLRLCPSSWHTLHRCLDWISLKSKSCLQLPRSCHTPSISFLILDFTRRPLARNKFGSSTHRGPRTSLHNDSNFGTTN